MKNSIEHHASDHAHSVVPFNPWPLRLFAAAFTLTSIGFAIVLIWALWPLNFQDSESVRIYWFIGFHAAPLIILPILGSVYILFGPNLTENKLQSESHPGSGQ